MLRREIPYYGSSPRNLASVAGRVLPGALTKRFKFGGWVTPYFYQEFGEELDRLFSGFDLLLGRKTYEIFGAYWPYYYEDAPCGGIAKFFQEIRKYAVVGST
jgi:hypothetical protein